MANKAKKTPAGTWRVRVYDYTDAAGRQHVRSFTAPTKAAAELKAAEFARAKKSRRQALEAGTVSQTVIDTDEGAVIKHTRKTATSLKSLAVPPFVGWLINESTTYQNYLRTGADGFLEPRSRSAIYGRWQTVTKHAGISMSFYLTFFPRKKRPETCSRRVVFSPQSGPRGVLKGGKI